MRPFYWWVQKQFKHHYSCLINIGFILILFIFDVHILSSSSSFLMLNIIFEHIFLLVAQFVKFLLQVEVSVSSKSPNHLLVPSSPLYCHHHCHLRQNHPYWESHLLQSSKNPTLIFIAILWYECCNLITSEGCSMMCGVEGQVDRQGLWCYYLFKPKSLMIPF